jgi:hypothetical protein
MKTCRVTAVISNADVTAPAGVSYSGARVAGAFIILRYYNERDYCDSGVYFQLTRPAQLVGPLNRGQSDC